MYDEESDEDMWITQSRYSKSDCAYNVDDLISYEEENRSLAAFELREDDACKGLTHFSDVDLAERIKDRIPKATRSCTDWAVGSWQEWARRRNSMDVNGNDKFAHVPTDIVGIGNEELNYWLAKFVLEIRKKESGDLYCGNTLYQMVCGLQRFIRDNGRPELNIFEQPEFKVFRDSLDAEMKRLISEGVGVLVKEAEPLTMDEENILWCKNLLGASNPRALLDTMVFLLGRCFALRGGKEHRALKFKQLRLVESVNGVPAKLCYCSFGEKNNKGGLKDRRYKPKRIEHHANVADPSRCVVELYREYTARCPKESVNAVNGPFYLRPKAKYVCDVGATWYMNVPVGHNTLGSTVKRLCQEAGIKGNKTNHSLRATTATRGLELGIPDKMLMERTGHRSVESLHRYQRPSEEQREIVSHALDNGKRQSQMFGGERLKRLCFDKDDIQEESVSGELASGSGNVVTFQNCNVSINNFNM